MDDDSDYKKAKGTNHKLKSQQIFKSEAHNVYTEEINKIPLSTNDNKTLQTVDRITIYAFKVCESEMLLKYMKVRC